MIFPVIIGILVILAVSVWGFLHQPSFGRLPSGERLERIKKSPHYRDGEFKNLHETPLMTGNDNRWKALWDFIFGSHDGLYPSQPIPVVRTDLKHLPADKNLMVWFGHSSYLLQIDGKRILVDPVFRAASPVSFINKPFKGTDIYKPEDMPDIDYLVISHDHWDHLDYQTVKELMPKVGKVICPLGVGEHFERWGYAPSALVELDWMQSAKLDTGTVVHCLPARHFSGRGLKSNQSLWASFLFEAPSLKVFIGGDSGYDTHFKDIARIHPGIDWVILENGQYNEGWKYIHTLPCQLHQEIEDLKAKNVVTVHHSKYALAKHRWDAPLQNAKELRKDDSLNVAIPHIGEILILEKDTDDNQ